MKHSNVRNLTSKRLARLPEAAKEGLNILFLAKHACSGGLPDAEDGNHAIYHHEMLTTLRAVGLNVTAANSYRALFDRPSADFVIPLLNRGGFQNSEMLAPLLLERHGLPYLGASPILRGLSDDKHLMKLVAAQRGVPTMRWQAYRIGSVPNAEPPFATERYVVKPNASSASWGVSICDDWREASDHVHALHAQRQDAIVEAWAPSIDVAVPVVGGQGPILLPAMAYSPEDGRLMRSHAEKRGLVPVADDPLVLVENAALRRTLEAQVRALLPELWPFDYGRFEFRVDPARGLVQFMEVNLSCNLWSKKTISRSAATLGIGHEELVESIVTHSLSRQGVLERLSQSVRHAVPSRVRANALVLAGQRAGGVDALAAAHGVSHKCMVPIAGAPLIQHVVAQLAQNPGIGSILVSIEEPELLTSIAAFQPLLRAGKLKAVRAMSNLADSVVAGAAAAPFLPLLITTADNVLLTQAMIDEMIDQANGTDVAVALTQKEAVLAAHPEGQQRFYEFGEQAWSNCNLYWLGNAKAVKAIEVFRTGGQFVKHPGRILNALGLTNLICFLFALGTVEKAFARISRRLGLNARAVMINDGAAAIDVDNARTHAIAEELLMAHTADWKAAA